ncbi:Cytochrome P450 [Sesbania bispinosa]|nr:Cytochrome P450 [Sesbania bispinosa]
MTFVTTMLFLLLTISTLIYVLSLHARTTKRNYKLPPGPSPLTIIANLLDLGRKPQQSLAKLAKTHGPIMRLKLGQVTTIVISSAEIAKEVLQTHDLLFSNRTIPQAVAVLNHDHYSLPFMPVSDLWRDLKKICKNQLFSIKTLDASQDLRRRKLQELLIDIHKSEADEYKDIILNLVKAIATPNLDLFVAGTDTTSYAIEMAMAELMHNPNTMSKAKMELEQTIGIGNPIEESDIARLPYLQAIIKETLRLHPPGPLLLPRKAKVDVEIHGYTIPRGAQVLINQWAMARNPKHLG